MIYRQKYWYIATVSNAIHWCVNTLLQLCCTFGTSLHPPADIHGTSPAHCILDLWTKWRKSFLCLVQRSSIWLRKWSWRGAVDEAIQHTHAHTHTHSATRKRISTWWVHYLIPCSENGWCPGSCCAVVTQHTWCMSTYGEWLAKRLYTRPSLPGLPCLLILFLTLHKGLIVRG